MAGKDDGEERNLPPTARRLQRLRQDGQVPRSADFEKTTGLTVALIYLIFTWRDTIDRFKASFMVSDASMPGGFMEEVSIAAKAQLQLLGDLIIPVVAIVCGAHILAIILDAKGIPLNFKAITPNFGKLNPVQGAKELFALRNFFELLKGLASMIVIITVNVFIFKWYLNDLMWSPSCGKECVMNVMVWLYGISIAASLLLLIIVALIDMPLSRILFNRDNKMTLSELKREQKEDSGAPEIRQARRALAQEIAQTAGYTGLSKANIVIAFGDRAVALVFKQNETAAPIIAARTFDKASDFIREAAMRKLPIVEEPELLLKLMEGAPGSYIPAPTFNEVARILIQTGVVKM
ncbi:MAG: EscU/YscU/HrcU family type III secretion system export apparatus switch protein [Pseudomonadota bacterium]